MKKKIFGKTFEFKFYSEITELVSKSLSDYSDSESDNVDVKVSIIKDSLELFDSQAELLSQNPSTNQLLENAFVSDINNTKILWEKSGDLLTIKFPYKKREGIKNTLRMLRKIEFSTEVERFEQILHELILVPSLYFFNDRMPIHSSAVMVNNKTILLAGTGGVGKSSALLAIRDFPNSKFIADDISCLSPDGVVYGNMAWPKIYAYNCVGTDLEFAILRNRTLLDRLHFKYRKYRDLASVRRKVKPSFLYDGLSSEGETLNSLNILYRENCIEFEAKTINIDDAISMMINVMLSEYQMFHSHIQWHEYNSKALGLSPIISMEEVKSNWYKLMKHALEGRDVNLIKVPTSINHTDYLEYIKSFYK